MKRALVAAVFALASCRTERVQSLDMCGLPCFEGLPERTGVGVCGVGRIECLDGGGQVCVGYGKATSEACDGKDNDCDGQVDEAIPNCCNMPTQEVCDGKDNDCDGQVDEAEDLPVDFCFEADKKFAAHKPCRPGVKQCKSGKWSCDGQVLPAPEFCDGVDNDCNGLVDDGLSGTDHVDLLFVVDNSGSMADKINMVQTSVQGFAARYGADAGVGASLIGWGLVGAPATDYTKYKDVPHLEVDLGPVAPFAAEMAKQNGSSGAGAEPTLDALWMACASSNPMGVSWGKGRRNIILFTDEEPQSHSTPKVTPDQIVAACVSAKIHVYLFVGYQGVFTTDPIWTKIAQDTGGKTYPIEWYGIGAELDTLVAGVTCR